MNKHYLQPSSLILNLLIIGLLFSATTCSAPSSCPTGVNQFDPVTGSQIIFGATKTILGTDVSIQKSLDGVTPVIQTTMFCKYILQNPSANVYNLIIQATNSVTGVMTPYSISVGNDQTFVGSYGGLVVMRQGTSNLYFYNIYQNVLSKILTIPSTDLIYTYLKSIIHTFGWNTLQISYYDSSTGIFYQTRHDPSFTSPPYYRTTFVPPLTLIPATSTTYFSTYIILEITTTPSINFYIMHSGDYDFKLDSTITNSVTNVYYDNIVVVTFFNSMLIFSADATYANSHVFSVAMVGISQVLNQVLTSSGNVPNSIKPFTDKTTTFAQVNNFDNNVVLFFVNNYYWSHFSFKFMINSASAPNDYMGIVADFMAAQEVKFSFSGSNRAGQLYTAYHYTFILKGSSIAKYTTVVSIAAGGSPVAFVPGNTPTYQLTKEFQIELSTSLEALLQDNTVGIFSFEIGIVCKCYSQKIVEFTCFSAGNNCQLTIQNTSQACPNTL